jgi:tetratricopeptide (TPR) repeat protein
MGLEFGDALLAAGDTDEAVRVWTAALNREPAHQRIYDRLVTALAGSGKQELAERRRAIFLLLSGSADYREAVRHLDAGEFDAAAALLRGLLSRNPAIDALRLKLAVALFASGDYKASAAEYRRLAESDSEDLDIRVQLGIALYRAGELAGAKQELEEVVAEDPRLVPGLYHLGLTFSAQGDNTRAMEFMHRARRLDPAISIPP